MAIKLLDHKIHMHFSVRRMILKEQIEQQHIWKE